MLIFVFCRNYTAIFRGNFRNNEKSAENKIEKVGKDLKKGVDKIEDVP